MKEKETLAYNTIIIIFSFFKMYHIANELRDESMRKPKSHFK